MKRLLLVPLALAVACNQAPGGADDEAAAAAEATDSVQVTNDESATLELALDGAGGAAKPAAQPTAEEVATLMAGRVGAALQPPACHTATTQGAT